MGRILTALNRFNAAHPWSHNDAYAWFVLRHARAVRRAGGRTAVDVGCGTGNLAARLAGILPEVIGIEPDLATARVAARRFAASDRVCIEQRRFGDEPYGSYDLIVFVASLHHMPLRATLAQARAALRPGGRILIVGVASEASADALRSLVSLAVNPIVGLLRHPHPATAPPASMRAPTAEPLETFDEIHAVAAGELPGIRMRRRLFWRYTAYWTAPLRGEVHHAE
ncbi:class I SAM-dependent methyltransferase [Microbacterium sp. KUDC0406]|uniref:class I SAM-dependent methyltransferase n=1 Tax=Microbacterium sp. KUDC0406 TaxID=2909588 RepID=UPI001F3BF181|nr:class I SAM-dependent methyltransferase [Microbacterium sp. KUDC0406]UJP11048.1 class I SAM-dependent methyltransferase [Microbacterium sp. KUDC0406]